MAQVLPFRRAARVVSDAQALAEELVGVLREAGLPAASSPEEGSPQSIPPGDFPVDARALAERVIDDMAKALILAENLPWNSNDEEAELAREDSLVALRAAISSIFAEARVLAAGRRVECGRAEVAIAVSMIAVSIFPQSSPTGSAA